MCGRLLQGVLGHVLDRQEPWPYTEKYFLVPTKIIQIRESSLDPKTTLWQKTAIYIKEKWKSEGNLSISKEGWFYVGSFQWKCTSSNAWPGFAHLKFVMSCFKKKINFWTGHPDEYLFGILTTACKKLLTMRWLLPHHTWVERYCKQRYGKDHLFSSPSDERVY